MTDSGRQHAKNCEDIGREWRSQGLIDTEYYFVFITRKWPTRIWNDLSGIPWQIVMIDVPRPWGSECGRVKLIYRSRELWWKLKIKCNLKNVHKWSHNKATKYSTTTQAKNCDYVKNHICISQMNIELTLVSHEVVITLFLFPVMICFGITHFVSY